MVLKIWIWSDIFEVAVAAVPDRAKAIVSALLLAVRIEVPVYVVRHEIA